MPAIPMSSTESAYMTEREMPWFRTGIFMTAFPERNGISY